MNHRLTSKIVFKFTLLAILGFFCLLTMLDLIISITTSKLSRGQSNEDQRATTLQGHYHHLLVVGIISSLALENDFDLWINIHKLKSNFSKFVCKWRIAEGRFPGVDKRWEMVNQKRVPDFKLWVTEQLKASIINRIRKSAVAYRLRRKNLSSVSGGEFER